MESRDVPKRTSLLAAHGWRLYSNGFRDVILYATCDSTTLLLFSGIINELECEIQAEG